VKTKLKTFPLETSQHRPRQISCANGRHCCSCGPSAYLCLLSLLPSSSHLLSEQNRFRRVSAQEERFENDIHEVDSVSRRAGRYHLYSLACPWQVAHYFETQRPRRRDRHDDRRSVRNEKGWLSRSRTDTARSPLDKLDDFESTDPSAASITESSVPRRPIRISRTVTVRCSGQENEDM